MNPSVTELSDSLAVVDAATNMLITTIPVGSSPHGLAVVKASDIFSDGFESGDTSAWSGTSPFGPGSAGAGMAEAPPRRHPADRDPAEGAGA